MTYVSQIVEMRQRGVDYGIGADQIQNDFRGALKRLQTIEGTTTSFASQQYVAEHQAWDLNWPENPFPGIDPRDPSTLAAPSSVSNPQSLQSPHPSRQEQSRRQTSKNQRTPQPSSSQAFATSSFPETSLGPRILKKKTRVHQRPLQTKATAAPDLTIIICANCGEKGHGIRICTRNIDQYGFLNGCPRYNTRKHNYADCPVPHKKDEYRYLVRLRIRKQPLRWNKDYPFGPDLMELDCQPISTFPQTGPPQAEPQQQTLTTAHKTEDQMQISPSDIQGVKSLLAILRQLEARRISNQGVERNTSTAPSLYSSSQVQTLSSHNATKKVDVAPMIFHSSEKHTFSSRGGAPPMVVAAPMRLDASSDEINNKSRPNNLGNFYEISPSGQFLIANSANMASVTYSQRQRDEFNMPPSPVRKLFPTSSTPRPLGSMNIPQILYAKSAIPLVGPSSCVNCKRPGHELKDCMEPCGLCDRARHTAADCAFRL
ncbi:hypothetical protein IFR05_008277 [Cadophora sp. M221]|nr:hypothetical protein IFR05_008277 [Cadophora sp. M221]